MLYSSFPVRTLPEGSDAPTSRLALLPSHKVLLGPGLVILSLGSETVDTSTATGKLILNMMVSVAQFEREMMKERQVEGIKRAQAEGKYKGRVPTAIKQADKVKALVEAGVSRVQVQEQLGISKASYYRCLKAS